MTTGEWIVRGFWWGFGFAAVLAFHHALGLISDEIKRLRQLLEERMPLSERERIRQHVPDDDDD